jgi:hypothetical protein
MKFNLTFNDVCVTAETAIVPRGQRDGHIHTYIHTYSDKAFI